MSVKDELIDILKSKSFGKLAQSKFDDQYNHQRYGNIYFHKGYIWFDYVSNEMRKKAENLYKEQQDAQKNKKTFDKLNYVEKKGFYQTSLSQFDFYNKIKDKFEFYKNSHTDHVKISEDVGIDVFRSILTPIIRNEEIDDFYSHKFNENGQIEMETNNIYDYFSSKGFFFSKEILTRYYLSLKTKSFVILSGISGTGKTKIAQLFASYICQEDDKVEAEKRVAFVSVRPDWMDNKGLLGYYNILDEKYHSTKVLDLLLEAQEHPEQPYFVILDEMNLAKVEHYFSDFLSIMESRTSDKPGGEPMPLHSRDSVENHKGRVIPEKLHIPANVFFAGTVNVDESTYMFSPKVLDRANVIEFNDVDLDGYAKGAQNKGTLLLRNAEVLHSLYNSAGQHFCRKQDYDALQPDGKQYLNELLNILRAYNLHFGYRVANEMSHFVNLAKEELADFKLEDVVDIQILQKILPKLHGTRAKLEEPLLKLIVFCIGHDAPISDEQIEKARSFDPDARFPRSAQKIAQMLKQLSIQGYVSFIE